MTFVEAITFLEKKQLMPTDMTSEELRNLDAAVRRRSFFSAQTMLGEYLQGAQDRIGNIVDPPLKPGENLNLAYAREQLKQLLKDLGYQPEAGEAGTIQDLSSDARINLVVRMNQQMAQGYGQWRQGQDPEVLDGFPCQELFRLEDRKEPRDWGTRWREAGGSFFGVGDEAPEGRMIARKDDPIWEEISAFGDPWPPFDFNSGMWTEDVSRAEAVELGVITEDDEVESQEGDFSLDE